MTDSGSTNTSPPRPRRGARPQVPPTMIRNLIYQIFPDRFSAAPGSTLQRVCPPDVRPHVWHAGGHLDGVRDRIPYLQSLGVDAVYLTPIQPAPSNHKYDASSFLGVDERFGGLAAFSQLAAELQSQSMGLILDAVFNHIGAQHDWVKEVQQNPNSVRSAWFRKDPQAPNGITNWRGSRSLLELDTSQSSVIQHLILDPEGPVQYWLDQGITGWRMDCANDLGWDFLRQVTRATAARRQQEFRVGCDGVVGEVMAFAASFTRSGRLDGVMNYWFREAVLGWLAGNLPTQQVQAIFESMFRRFPHRSLIRSWNILSSHDTPRLATLLPSESQRLTALALQFFLPGVPMLYYGEEWGMEGGPDPDNRRPMDWTPVDSRAGIEAPLAQPIRLMAGLRQQLSVLKQGRVRLCPTDVKSGVLAFLRYEPARPVDFAILVVRGPEPESSGPQTVFVPCEGMFDGLPLVDALQPTQNMIQAQAGTLQIPPMPGCTASLYLPAPRQTPGYSFFKPCWDDLPNPIRDLS